MSLDSISAQRLVESEWSSTFESIIKNLSNSQTFLHGKSWIDVLSGEIMSPFEVFDLATRTSDFEGDMLINGMNI